METPNSKRRSTRNRQSVNYQESPIGSTNKVKNKQISPEIKNEKSRSQKKSMLVDAEDEKFSPKKLRHNRTPSTKALESIVTESSPTVENLNSPSSFKKSARIRTPNSRLNDYNLQTTTPGSSRRKRKTENIDESIETIEVIDDSLNESADDKENKLKATTLFDEDVDVEGRKLYSFKTPKKREGMNQLANATPKTPRHHNPDATTPRTPKHLRLSEIQKTPTSRPSASKCTKTPRHIRDKIKKGKTTQLIKISDLI